MNNTLKARVGANFLSKVTRLFDSKPETILSELIQNARRAGATKVEITAAEHGNSCNITIKDNGRGIKDLSQLLSLSDSCWEEPTLSDEDPAGMGLFCLANLKTPSAITSGNGTVVMDQDVFSGKKAAEIVRHEKLQDGTAITFSLPSRNAHIYKIKDAVRWANLPEVILNGERIDSKEFVTAEEATIIDEELGVRVKTVGNVGYRRFRTNFHGILLESEMPSDYRHLCDVCVNRGLAFEIEILHTRHVKMVLPARNALMGGEGMDRLADLCERAAFLHFQKKGSHKLPYSLWKRAASLGIDLPEADLHTALIMLEGFRGSYLTHEASAELRKKPILLVEEADWFSSDMFSDLFAAEGIRLARKRVEFEGYPSYDSLQRTRMLLSADGYEDIEEYLGDNDLSAVGKLDVTGLKVSLKDTDIEPASIDFAVLSQEVPGNDFGYLDSVLVMEVDFKDVHDIITFAVEKWFKQSDDWDSGSQDEQERCFEEQARDHYLTLCCSAEDALEACIKSRIGTDLREKLLYGSLKGKTLTMRVSEDWCGNLEYKFSYE